jgi:hypothetical protein
MSDSSIPHRSEVNPPRDLTPTEHQILERLLSYAFPGRDELRDQLLETKVGGVCTCGCPTLDLVTESLEHLRAPVRRRVPIEASYDDADGGQVSILVHVVNGFLNELEFYRPDGQDIRAYPVLERLRIFSPEIL